MNTEAGPQGQGEGQALGTGAGRWAHEVGGAGGLLSEDSAGGLGLEEVRPAMSK